MKPEIKILILSVSAVVLLLNCSEKSENDRPVVISGQLPQAPAPAPVTKAKEPTVETVKKPVYVYGNSFRVYNSGLYRNLLETCRRCGLKRLIQGPFGQTQYQRFWTSYENPKRCENWLSQGYVQIEFSEDKLPTTAKVLIQPKYTGAAKVYDLEGNEQEIWGEAFEITAPARPINENNGFEILVNPADGLLGAHSMTVKSEDSNHIKNSDLHITISYGQQDSQTFVSQTLSKLTKRAVKPAKFKCSQYTN